MKMPILVLTYLMEEVFDLKDNKKEDAILSLPNSKKEGDET